MAAVVAVLGFVAAGRRAVARAAISGTGEKSAGTKAYRANSRRVAKKAPLRRFGRADQPRIIAVRRTDTAVKPQRAVPMVPYVAVGEAGERRSKPVWAIGLAERYRNATAVVATRRVGPVAIKAEERVRVCSPLTETAVREGAAAVVVPVVALAASKTVRRKTARAAYPPFVSNRVIGMAGLGRKSAGVWRRRDRTSVSKAGVRLRANTARS